MASTIRGSDNFDSGSIAPSTTHGDVGTYLYGYYKVNGATVASGASIAGSSIRAAGMGWNTGSDGYERCVRGDDVAKSGTWRFMGSMSTNISGRYPGGIWVRIS